MRAEPANLNGNVTVRMIIKITGRRGWADYPACLVP
jgi:hypothetical protein